MEFQDLTPKEQQWVDAYLDGTIEPEDFEALQNRMLESPALRAVMRRYLALDNSLRHESEADDSSSSPWQSQSPPLETTREPGKWIAFPNLIPLAAAAMIAFFVGIGLTQLTSRNSKLASSTEPLTGEAFAEGFAVVGNLFDAQWPAAAQSFLQGDTLGAETFRLESGTAVIQFFSGATMTLEGPAEISLKSAWEAQCVEGAVRMRVPPAARGFKLNGPETQIVDLGTEFGMVVKGGEAQVEVFDGEIALQHRNEGEQILRKGGALDLPANGNTRVKPAGEGKYPDVSTVVERADDLKRIEYEQWSRHRDLLAQDPRLIAYYTFDRSHRSELIPNLTLPRNPEFDGAVILAEPVDGRWPELKKALEFRRPGARVRVNISGEFPAYTFMCWVRIDSLDRWYNALFMGDGYETGEPHWQIRDDGSMMLSVMVDDTKPNPGAPNDAGFHRVYYSPPMWDRSMSGEWLHLVSVFDPENRRVSHYVNGERIHRQEMEDRFYIDKLRIGNGEIGNWGQPFREEPTFAIRNLNGRMDEIAIFKAALQDEEIAALYERSRAKQR